MTTAHHHRRTQSDRPLTLRGEVSKTKDHHHRPHQFPTNNSDDADSECARSISIATQRGIYVTPHPPVGFKNVGNTCYANATLQCLLSTALASALMDPRCFVVFRRYASNVKLLESNNDGHSASRPHRSKNATKYPIVAESIPSEESTEGLLRYSTSLSASDSNEKRGRRHRTDFTSSHKNENSSEMFNEYESEIKQQGSNCSDATVATNCTRKLMMRAKNKNCQWLTDQLVLLCQKYRAQPIRNFFGGVKPVDPAPITRNVSRLSKCLRYGRQEDAHEFLRSLLSTLVMDGHNRKLSALFDGLLESAVTCCTCGHSSLTRDRYMDLSLEIDSPKCDDLTSALRLFTRTETLSQDNLVDCANCQKRRQVTKGLRLATTPTILVLHLKRFSFDRYGRLTRISKHIRFPMKLGISEFMSLANKSIPRLYELVGVLVHVGKSCNRGHYLAFVSSGESWYRVSDSDVQEVSEEVVMRQNAYILMYQVESVKKHRAKGLVKVTPNSLNQGFHPGKLSSESPFSLGSFLNLFTTCGVDTVAHCWGAPDSEKVSNTVAVSKTISDDSSVKIRRTGGISKSWSSKNQVSKSKSEASSEISLQKTMSESSASVDNPAKVKVEKMALSLAKDSRPKRASPPSSVNRLPSSEQRQVMPPYRIIRGASSGNLKERGEAAAKAYAKKMGGVDLSHSIHSSSPSPPRRPQNSSPVVSRHKSMG